MQRKNSGKRGSKNCVGQTASAATADTAAAAATAAATAAAGAAGAAVGAKHQLRATLLLLSCVINRGL
jgi:hypothetical protein